MPILDVELVHAPHAAALEAGLARRLADAAAQVFGLEPGRVWVRLRVLPAERYAENAVDHPPHPAFISVLLRELPPRERLAREAQQLAASFGPLLDRPAELVHVVFEPPGAGRVAFGGRLI